MTIELSKEDSKFVAAQIERGLFVSEAEVVAAALDSMKETAVGSEEDAARLQWLIAALDEGEASGIYEGDAFAEVRKELGLPAKA
jgi:putative addiction module CopG family antidote